MEAILDRLSIRTNFETMGKITGAQKIFSQVCVKNGLPPPSAEYKFHPTRQWRIDYFFYNPISGIRIALEVEGGVWGLGRHNRPSGFIKDMEKYNALALDGIFLLRVLPRELVTIKTITLLKQALKI